MVRVRRSALRCGAYTVPGDPSQAAFWLVGSVIIPGSLVTVTGIDLSAERLGFVGVLRRMGATIEVEEAGNGTGSLTGYTALLHGTVVEAAEIPSLDEVPVLAVAAAAATGTTRFRDVGELRVKESDRLAGTAELVRAFGADGRRRGGRSGGGGTRGAAAAGRGRCPGRPPDGHGRGHRRRRVPGRRRPHHHRRMGVGGHQLPVASPTICPCSTGDRRSGR